MKISIVTVCYNASKAIEETLLSVINQTYEDVEYIVIDGGSTDGTVDIIKKYSDKISYWVSEPDKGIYDAMNKGIDAAMGEWINFMNAGDMFTDSNTLELVADSLSNLSDADIVYGQARFVYEWGSVECPPLPLTELRKHMVFCHQASFVKTSLMRQAHFDVKYRIAGDYNFFYHQYVQNRKFVYIPICVAVYDSVFGISSRQHIICEEEYARINGRIETFSWKIIHLVDKIRVKIKSFVKSMLPQRIVRNVRRRRVYMALKKRV